MFDRCKHKWKVLSETTTESKYEHMKKNGMTKISGYIRL